MIETIYNSENSEDMQVKLPKNIRQIGSGETKYHIYIEDKVWEYLQLLPENKKNIRYGILVGEAKFSKGETYLFVRGAVEVCDIIDNLLLFGDDVWAGLYDDLKRYYQGEKIVGWYSSVEDFKERDLFQIRKIHLDHFAGNDKIYLNIDREEGEGDFYGYQSGELEKILCYHIYFEKNAVFDRYVFETHYNFAEKKKKVRMETEELPSVKIEEKTENQEKVPENQMPPLKKRGSFGTKAVSFAMMGVLVFTAGMMYRNGDFAPLSQDIKEVVAGIVNRTPKEDEVLLLDDTKETSRVVQEESQVLTEPQTEGQTVQEETVLQTEVTTQLQQETEVVTEEVTAAIEPQIPKTYTVQKGDTLYNICKKIYGNTENVNKVIELNHLDDTGKIVDGMTLKMP